MKNQSEKPVGEFIIHFNQTTVIKEEVNENSLEGLCSHVFEAIETFGDPVKVTFPNGKEYYWGEMGTFLAHQFAGEGRINETEFLTMLTEHNSQFKQLAQQNLDKYTAMVKACKAEIKICEQRTQEAINELEHNFENYMIARRVFQSIEMKEENHG